MSPLSKPSKTILKECMGLKKTEKCLIITDKNKLNIANAVFLEAKNICDNVELIEIPVGKIDSEEQPAHVAEEMKKYDVIIILTTKSLSHTLARKQACEAGARIASMPGLLEESMLRCIDVDYDDMNSVFLKIKKIMTQGKILRIVSDSGTDITMNIENRKIDIDKGIYKEKGKWGNLPAGEVAVAPAEGTANGIYIVDASMAGTEEKLVDAPIKITVKEGYAVKIEGGLSAKELEKTLKKFSKESRNIAEFGIGINPKAKVIGSILEDEKAVGTAHIALGDNFSLGGIVKAPCHLDGVFYAPTVFIDGKKIMEKGKLIM